MRGHGRPYELGDARYSGPGVCAPDPYYAPPPAPHTEPWHARPPPPPPPPPPPAAPVYPEEGGYHRSYYDDDYGRDYDYEYGYEEPGAYAMRGPSRGYADFERSGYDYDDYAHGRSYARTHDPHMPHMPHPPLPPPPQPAELAAVPASVRRRGTPLPSPPRIWELGPRAAHVDARRSGVRSPRPPPDPLPLAAAAPESASRSASSSSSSATSAVSLTNTHATSSKKELLEYCKVHGYPLPRFFDALDDSENADGPGGAAARYKVWVVLGEERLELPRTYAAIEEGEEKMARNVLRHLRSRDMGGAAEEG